MSLIHFSHHELAVAFWVAAFTVAVVFLFLILTVILRAELQSRQKQRREFINRWEPWLTKNLSNMSGPIPEVTKVEERVVLQIVNYYYELLSGTAKEKLDQLAAVLGARSLALKMLKSRRVDDQLLGLSTLRQLADRSSWPALQKLIGSQDSAVSLAAARAFVRSDPEHAMLWVAPLVIERSDWACDKVAFMLKEAGPDAVSKPVVDSVSQAKKEYLPRLVPYLRFAEPDLARPLLHRIVENNANEPEILCSSIELLGLFGNTQDLLTVRAHLHHANWKVRATAVTALKQIGAEDDQKELLSLMRDREPWVRYQAAHALATLPFMNNKRLEEVLRKQADFKSAEALVQVMAERRLNGES